VGPGGCKKKHEFGTKGGDVRGGLFVKTEKQVGLSHTGKAAPGAWGLSERWAAGLNSKDMETTGGWFRAIPELSSCLVQRERRYGGRMSKRFGKEPTKKSKGITIWSFSYEKIGEEGPKRDPLVVF